MVQKYARSGRLPLLLLVLGALAGCGQSSAGAPTAPAAAPTAPPPPAMLPTPPPTTPAATPSATPAIQLGPGTRVPPRPPIKPSIVPPLENAPFVPIAPAGNAPQNPAAYEAAARDAAARHLAERLGIAASDVTFLGGERREVPSARPCGEESAAGGLTIGYEMRFAAAGATYRYVAAGGLAHACDLR